ncbi:MAG: hypothetical protein ABIQ18_10855, partial [Umezawaea sp.]
MNGLRRTASCAAVVSVALFGGITTTASAAPAVPPAADPLAQPAPSGSARPYEHLLVGYKTSAEESRSDTAASEDAKDKGDKVGRDLTVSRRLATGATVVDLGGLTTAGDAAKTIEEFRADPDVAYVEPDLLMQPMANPSDSEYTRQWDLFEPAGGMNVPGAWRTSTGTGVVVAVIDTGYVTHSDLAGQTVAGYDFVSDAARARDGGGRDSDPS